MSIDKSIQYVKQGGVKNYLGKQKEVKAPIKWKSSPNHPETELAYITKAEKDLLVKKDLHGSLKGGVNRGPSGIISLNGFGSADESQNVGGGDISSAETGGGRSGMSQSDANDFRSAAIASGAGQRVNPGFFDSRNVVSPEEIARAKAFDPSAFGRVRGSGIGSFLSGGGFFGNLIRGLGRKLGFGKNYNQPTYDMSKFSGLPLGGSAAFENLDIRDKFNRNSKFRDYLDIQKLSPDAITFEEYLENIDQAPTGIMSTSSLPANNLLAFAPNSKLDRALKNLYSGYENLGIQNPQMLDLMKQDLEENKQKGTPLSLPKEAYSLIG